MEFVVLGVGVVFIVVSIAVFRLHPFLALILAAITVGILSPNPLRLTDQIRESRRGLEQRYSAGEITTQEFQRAFESIPSETRAQAEGSQTPAQQSLDALELTAQEFGSTAASIGIVIVLAAIIGQCLLESGAADKITRALLRTLGQERAALSLMSSGYFLSIPVFFDTVFFLLIPLARALRMRTKRDYVAYVMAISGGAVVSHSLVPPTPGPLIMVENLSPLGLKLGTAILGGFLLGLLPVGIGLLFSQWRNSRMNIPFRDAPGSSKDDLEEIVHRSEDKLPSLAASLLPVVLPVILIAGHSILKTLDEQMIVPLGETVLSWTAVVGNKNFALLAGAAFALVLLKRQRRYSFGKLRDRLDPAIMSAGVIILITAAGGAFGKMLYRCGIGEALSNISGGEQISALALIVLAWLLSSLMKIAQGSGTVAMITASAMVFSLSQGIQLSFHPLYLFAAIGFGSLVISWMNDSAFWVICKMGGLTEKETLTTWTPLLVVIGIVGLLEVLILSQLLPMT
jgi:GntP family gluconate:H+ symporter